MGIPFLITWHHCVETTPKGSINTLDWVAWLPREKELIIEWLAFLKFNECRIASLKINECRIGNVVQHNAGVISSDGVGTHCGLKPYWHPDIWSSFIDAIWKHRSGSSFGWGNGLLPDGTKPLPEPMLTYHERYSLTITPEKFHKTCSST